MKEVSFFSGAYGKMYLYATRNESSVKKIRRQVVDYLYANNIHFDIDFKMYGRCVHDFFVEGVSFEIEFECFTYPSTQRHLKKSSLYEDIEVLFSEDGKIDNVTIDLSTTYNLRGSDIIKIIEDVPLINSGKFKINKIHPQLSKQL